MSSWALPAGPSIQRTLIAPVKLLVTPKLKACMVKDKPSLLYLTERCLEFVLQTDFGCHCVNPNGVLLHCYSHLVKQAQTFVAHETGIYYSMVAPFSIADA